MRAPGGVPRPLGASGECARGDSRGGSRPGGIVWGLLRER
jgi:hypothetical protein